ncbi:HAMP domain-containing sensor histidine kinase [Amycolatopsis sp. EV170708-02-1]|uniref:sensor histidine kinase n=1 Tax=Amycolatopsis sp. EV170708-02-1 TaxID=2919322 RepID=UPI001F0BAB57|nr:HAMP domain-containing sensor histidine kinase [Amycolatopsis sp. EV170708-02-1]UMP03647.1 HAMP domain-containing histidine kinase [Amycolatopsis sp. EV170708-02-1]
MRLLSGLRPRLILAFAAMTIIGAAAAAGASYVSARTEILEAVQDAAMNQLKDRVSAYGRPLSTPPTQDQLNDFAGSLRLNAVAVYRDMRSVNGPDLTTFSPELRQTVASDGRIQFQRVDRGTIPELLVGLPVLARQPDGTMRNSGVEVYSLTSLVQQQQAIDELAKSAWQTAALVLPLAVALALLAARQVLRPVRALNTAAAQLGEGRLDVRLPAKGSDELAELVTTFNNTAAELERTVGELRAMEADARRFVADVSHELRTPLAAMNAVTDVLDEDAETLPPDTAVAARLVSGETRRLTRLVQDLVEISRFDAGRAELVLDEWDLATAIRDSLDARGWRDGEGLVTDLPEGVLARVDRRRLDLIVANLVGNAFRHGAAPVEVRLRDDGGEVTLTVEDHGPGIDPAVLPHVFDRFTKADTARARSEGSGLGLAIALENARLHGGDITAADSGHGARFVLRLPAGGTR